MLNARADDSLTATSADIGNKRRSWLARIGAAFSAAVGVVAGVAPHVLHHAGPIAGAALLAGTGGILLFGTIGLVLTIPMLLRLRRRFDSWAAPSVALALFAVAFAVSTLWIGPAIRRGGEGGLGAQPFDHASHHPG